MPCRKNVLRAKISGSNARKRAPEGALSLDGVASAIAEPTFLHHAAHAAHVGHAASRCRAFFGGLVGDHGFCRD